MYYIKLFLLFRGMRQAIAQAFRKCVDNIAKKDLSMDTFISDRHSSIAKHFREKLPVVKHYFDLWHLVKSMCHQPIDWQ